MGRGQDEKSEFEFQHPPQARLPLASEVAEERQRAMYCQPCKDQGRQQMAHRLLPGRRGICRWCINGEPHPEERKKKPEAAAVVKVGVQAFAKPASCLAAANEEQKEEVMAAGKCGCGREEHHRGACWFRRGKKGPGKAAPGAPGSSVPRRSRSAGRPANGGDGTVVQLPVSALDHWFESLPEKEREELLGRLWEQLPAEQKASIFAQEVGA